MRSFPSASRRRLAATATVAAMALGATAIPHAWASDGDDLKSRRDHVQSQIQQTQGELEHASKQAQRANGRLADAQARLRTAQSRLADVRDQLAAARTRDVQMRQELAAAEARLVTAREQLAAARVAAAEQRDEVADSVVTIYEQGDPQLRALSALVNAESLTDLELESETERTLVSNESSVFAGLRLARKRLADQEEQVQLAQEEAERQRLAAAQHLATVRDLETRAATAAVGVRDQVGNRRDARRAAVRARDRDRTALARLKQREQRIKQLIMKAAQRDSHSYTGDAGGLLR